MEPVGDVNRPQWHSCSWMESTLTRAYAYVRAHTRTCAHTRALYKLLVPSPTIHCSDSCNRDGGGDKSQTTPRDGSSSSNETSAYDFFCCYTGTRPERRLLGLLPTPQVNLSGGLLCATLLPSRAFGGIWAPCVPTGRKTRPGEGPCCSRLTCVFTRGTGFATFCYLLR